MTQEADFYSSMDGANWLCVAMPSPGSCDYGDQRYRWLVIGVMRHDMSVGVAGET